MNLKAVKRFSSRFMIGIWWLSIIVLASCYGGTLMSYMTYPLTEFYPRNFKELAESVQKNKYACGTSAGNIIWTDMLHSKSENTKILKDHISSSNNFIRLPYALDRVQEGRFAYILHHYIKISEYRNSTLTIHLTCLFGTLQEIVPEDIEYSTTEEETSTDEPTMAFFRDKLGKILCISTMKIIVIIVYFLNLLFGIWGALTITHGVDYTKLYPQKSVITQGIKLYYNSFGRYTFPYQIVINSTLDYSDLNVQRTIDELVKKFESLPHIADSRFTVSWLKYYKKFQNHSLAKYSLRGYNMSVKEDFLDGLRNVFLKFKSAEQFTNDIAFNSDGSDILSSRFHIFVNDTLGAEDEIEMLKNLWKIADDFDFPVLVYAALTPLYEQGIIIGRTIRDLLWITSLLVMILFIVTLPNIVVAFLVAISVTSTIVETLGYMSLWGINMDIFSMMSLILCVGFCVNYPAHMSYAYICSLYQTPNERMKDSLYRIGYPIFQGSLSTILGILFVYRDMYAFIIFVKVVFLIAIETAFHALMFIPVVFSLISPFFLIKGNNEI
ncbi:patched domain-containing protein 3-like [Centruroides sculpturatus]|uniref:patched domain-containing protein 3-like n=1 Tax=Centruroides sculpturatus TaxID=218467 RepID=UPI000C6E4A70|nr:patched domain-containing protein 3-like [Centruroides sculpturatus]